MASGFFRRSRVFEEEQVQRFHHLRKLQSIASVVLPVAIYREIDLVSDGFSNGFENTYPLSHLFVRDRTVPKLTTVLVRDLPRHTLPSTFPIEVKLNRLVTQRQGLLGFLDPRR